MSIFEYFNFIPKWVRNPFLIVGLFFIVWMLFFDENNLATQWKLSNKLYELNTQIEYYNQQINQTKTELYELRTNSETKEKFAREHYFMKRDNEDIFVFISTPKPETTKHWWQKIF